MNSIINFPNGREWLFKKSHSLFHFKSSIGTIEKSSFLLHVSSVTCITCAVPIISLEGEFIAFMVPHSFVALRPRRLTSSFKTKLCIALVPNNVRTVLPLMVTFTYMSHFFMVTDNYLLSMTWC